ncbi:MAG: DUF4157 domain-containing protein [Acidobacteriota bacterium]
MKTGARRTRRSPAKDKRPTSAPGAAQRTPPAGAGRDTFGPKPGGLQSRGPTLSLPRGQAKGLAFGRRGDRWEREADDAADRILGGTGVESITPVSAQALTVHESLDESVQEHCGSSHCSAIQETATDSVQEMVDAPLQESEPLQEAPVQGDAALQETADEASLPAQESSDDEPAQEMAATQEAAGEGPLQESGEATLQESTTAQGSDSEGTTQERPGARRRTTVQRHRKAEFARRAIAQRGTGTPLPNATRGPLEAGFGTDLSAVRVHQDASSRELTGRMGARAFTRGKDIYLGPGESAKDLRLMAHETTHTLQQGAVARRPPVSDLGGTSDEVKVPEGKAKAPEKPTGPDTDSSTPARATKPAPKTASRPSPGAGRSATGRGSRGAGRRRAAAGSAAVRFQGSPADRLDQLAKLSPVRAPFVIAAFQKSSAKALDGRRKGEDKQRPKANIVPRSPKLPTGPPAPPTADEKRPAKDDVPSLAADGKLPDAPTPPAPTGNAPGVPNAERKQRDLDAISGEGSFMERILSWVRQFLGDLPTRDPGVYTDPGPAPTVALTGKADLGQIETFQASGSRQVAKAQTKAEDDAAADFGEFGIEPANGDSSTERAVPESIHRMGSGCGAAEELPALAFDPPHEAELGQRVHEKIGPRWQAQQTKVRRAEQRRDARIARQRRTTDDLIAGAHADSYKAQDDAANAARQEVAKLRGKWSGENLSLQTGFETDSTGAGNSMRQKITGKVTRQEGLVAGRYQILKTTAEGKKAKIEEKAKEEKRQARSKSKKKSKSWFRRGLDWAKSKFRDLMNAAMRKIKGWFDDLRAWAKRKFEELKTWAVGKINEARKWAIDRLEDLRGDLNGLVDRYLGDYPVLARRFKGAINFGVDTAQRGVNAAADNLEENVGRYIDYLASEVDDALVVAETLTVGALQAACDLGVLGFNMIGYLVEQDLDALIVLIRELPEHPPLGGSMMSIIKAALIGFLETVRDKPADEKKRYVEKTRWLVISPSYYVGVLAGVVKGLVWDGLVGTVRILYDLFVELPGTLKQIWDFFYKMATDTEAIEQIITAARGVRAEVDAFFQNPRAAEQMAAFLKKSPQLLEAWIANLMKEGREWAYRAGASAADKLFDWILKSSKFKIGLAVGSVVGQIIFEVLLAYFTAGAGSAVKWGGKALQVAAKGLKLLVSGVRRGGGLILKALGALRKVARAGLTLAKKLGGGMKKIFGKARKLLDKVFDWFKRQFARFKKKKKKPKQLGDGDGGDRGVFAAYKLRVKTALKPYSVKGIARRGLRSILNAQRTGAARRVVRRTFIKEVSQERYRSYAVVKFSKLPRKVATVKKQRSDRIFDQFKRTVKAELVPYKRKPPVNRAGGIALGDLNDILRRNSRQPRFATAIQRAYVKKIARQRYRAYALTRDPRQNRKVDDVRRMPTGIGRSAAIPFTWFKPTNLYQSLTLNPRSATSTRYWTTVPPIHPSPLPVVGAHRVQNTRSRQNNPRSAFFGRPFLTLGINPINLPRHGKKMRLRRSPHTRRLSAALRRFLRSAYRAPLAQLQIDHVQDLAWGGHDRLDNLFPLLAAHNRSTQASINNQRVEHQHNNRPRTVLANTLLGRWFRIRRIAPP